MEVGVRNGGGEAGFGRGEGPEHVAAGFEGGAFESLVGKGSGEDPDDFVGPVEGGSGDGEVGDSGGIPGSGEDGEPPGRAGCAVFEVERQTSAYSGENASSTVPAKLERVDLVTIGPRPVSRPAWLRAPAPAGDNYRELKQMITDLKLHTVCESAACPNVGECWNRRTATFMILGNVCTRRCGFCAVQKGGPLPVDYDEPARVAEAVSRMGLAYAVVTSVNRDDRKDGGAELFAMTLEAIRQRVPGCKVEVLVPDFQGNRDAMKLVMEARPDVLNHNTETVPRLYRQVRLGARYERSLEMLRYAKELAPGTPVKSGLMLGLGETLEEVLVVMKDLHVHRVNILTLGQYLRPSPKHLPIVRYVSPDEFTELRKAGMSMGFAHVEAGPLVRSSYHADDSHASAAVQ